MDTESKLVDIKKFQTLLFKWYKLNGRPFFWRKNKNTPWDWFFIEFCLQRTRAETVNKYVPNLLKKYHDAETVVNTSIDELENDFRKLGYYKIRAKKLQIICEYLISKNEGNIPCDYDKLMSIPHVGEYITKAILCFAFNQRYNLIDSNIARIVIRLTGISYSSDVRSTKINQVSLLLLPKNHLSEYHYALIDIASLICKKIPRCSLCPLLSVCLYSIPV